MTSRSLGRISDTGHKSYSFHVRRPAASDDAPQPQRLHSHPELIRQLGGPIGVPGNPKPPENGAKKLTKLLLNVTIQRSLGPVQVVISPGTTVEDLIKSTLEIYVKEKRRPLLIERNPRFFELHYSQFNLDSLNRKEKLMNLGSRNFFLCAKAGNSSCSDEAKIIVDPPFQWTKFMDFLL